MIRILLLLLIAGNLARASEPINAPVSGASATVTQPHVTAELIPETTTIQPGAPFDVALHLRADSGWHTYWINPGDAGMATTITWTLPPGFTAGPIQWPTPEKHNMGPLMTYGYVGDVYLLTTITPPKSDLPQHLDVKAHAEWLVCKEECIPGHADFTLPLDSGLMNLRLPQENKELFAQARERLPVPNTRWDVSAEYGKFKAGEVGNGQEILFMDLRLEEKDKGGGNEVGKVSFFPEQPNVLATQRKPGGWPSSAQSKDKVQLCVDLQQNGDTPDKLSGVLASDRPLIGNAKAVYIAEFPVTTYAPSASAEGLQLKAAAVPSGGAVSGGPATPGVPAPATFEGTATLLAVLGAAFIGGLILNLMPCVLPVLSLKVFSLMKHAGENPKAAWIQGVAFTAGVVLSFWVLAGLLLALRAAGNQIGWGFQMQSPGFVLALILLFFLLGLNLFGVFELGSSLVGLDAKATGHLGGLASSFGNGALATLAATPCTAPFMGSALGFAAQQPAFISLLIFTFLALGMATPYLLLTIFPGALRFVPKPGAWMVAFKQFMGFLLMATVIFLVYVFGALVGNEQIPGLLGTLLLWALVAWFYGRWGPKFRWVRMMTLAIFVVCLFSMWDLISVSILESAGTVARSATATTKAAPALFSSSPAPATFEGWQPWSQTAVDAALAQGRPVFVDFTAAWCLSCKVNEIVALDADSVKQAFAQKNVALFRADWTHSDPAISEALRQYYRDGVPLYLLYSPKNKDAPQVLPEVLTPGIVLDALKKM